MSKIKISSEYRNTILNILHSLSKEVITDIVTEPIIKVNQERDIIIIGVNRTTKVLIDNGDGSHHPENRILSNVYILKSLLGVWNIFGNIKDEKLLLDIDFNNELLIVSSAKQYKESIASVTLYSVTDSYVKYEHTIYDPVYYTPNNKEISLFGNSIVISNSNDDIYISNPISKELGSIVIKEDLVRNPGLVYEYMRINNKFINTRIISLSNKYLEDKNHIGLGCKLELKNNDNTLCMTAFDGSTFSYLLNQPKDLNYDYSKDSPKICFIDDLVEVV